MTWRGGTWSTASVILSGIAGVALPVLVTAIALLGYRRSVRSDAYHVAHTTLTVGVGTTLPWLVLPVVGTLAPLPSGDDVTLVLAAGAPARASTARR